MDQICGLRDIFCLYYLAFSSFPQLKLLDHGPLAPAELSLFNLRR